MNTLIAVAAKRAKIVYSAFDRLKTNGIVLMGASLGGNAVLKFVGEGAAPNSVVAVASVCAPIDLKMAQMQIMALRNRLYHRYLIRRMKADALNGAPDSKRKEISEILQSVKTVYDFDDRIVAQNSGFKDAASDPWIPLSMYLNRNWPHNALISLVVSKDGGHVGFHGQQLAAPWHNVCVSRFF